MEFQCHQFRLMNALIEFIWVLSTTYWWQKLYVGGFMLEALSQRDVTNIILSPKSAANIDVTVATQCENFTFTGCQKLSSNQVTSTSIWSSLHRFWKFSILFLIKSSPFLPNSDSLFPMIHSLWIIDYARVVINPYWDFAK